MDVFVKHIFVKQMLPPHWRNTWREPMLRALLTPVFNIYKRFASYRRKATENINMSAQIFVINVAVRRVSGAEISNVADNNDGSFTVYLPAISTEKRADILQLINAYKPSGSRYNLQPINENTKNN